MIRWIVASSVRFRLLVVAVAAAATVVGISQLREMPVEILPDFTPATVEIQTEALGLSLPGLIGGSVIVESVFAIPGMGQLMVQAVFERDYPVIMGNLVIVSTLTLVANLLADISYGLVDPRIRVGRRVRR